METYDAEKAARVWNRVRSDTPIDTLEERLAGMILEEWTDAATYLQLSRITQGRPSQLLHRLYEQEQAHAACLKGIYTLLTGKRPSLHSPAPKKEPLETTLRRCYGREMRCLAEYESLSAHREYGPVFTRLADQERDHCRTILELLGNLKEGK